MNSTINYKLKTSSESGFLALMSAIIISAVLMIVIFSVGFSGFMTRFNILDSEYKTTSYNLAENYVNQAWLKLSQNLSLTPTYSGTQTLNYPSGCTSNCDYYSIIAAGGSPNNLEIRGHSVYQKATTNIKVTASYSGGVLTITKWEELPNF